MKDVWILSVKTTLPNGGDMTTSLRAFADFKAAREALRKVLKKVAFARNEMFDGAGGLTMLNRYIGEDEDWDEEEDFLSPRRLQKISAALEAIFRGEDVKVPLKAGDYTDYMVAVKVEEDRIAFSGDDDGPCNGYDPVLTTNMFSMEREKEWYYLYILDLFGQDYASELYIDLKKGKLVE